MFSLLLFFSYREGVLQEIPYNEHEKRDLILLRNELAYYLTRKVQLNRSVDKVIGSNKLSWSQSINSLNPPELPEPINHSACEKCPYNIICSTFLKYVTYSSLLEITCDFAADTKMWILQVTRF